MATEFWTIKEAAEAWGVCWRTAHRYAKILRGGSRCKIPKGTPPPRVRRGNPNFRNPAKQAEYAAKRWPLTLQERMAIDVIVHEEDDSAYQRLVDYAGRMLRGEPG